MPRRPVATKVATGLRRVRATITTTDGKTVSLSGVTILRFDQDGLVREHRDYWAMTKRS